jgi:hypothetical protein
MRTTRFAALFSLLVPTTATAAPVLTAGVWSISDGKTYDASIFPNASVVVSDGTLNIGPGGNLLSISAYYPGGTVNMSGGLVDQGISVAGSAVSVSGGQSRGFSGTTFGDDALSVFNGTGRITGGTFAGGNSPGQAGSAVVASAGQVDGKPASSTLDISGGTFVGGTGSGGYYGGTTGYSLLSLGNTTVTGGHFLSPIAINGAYGGVTDILGSHLSFSNNTLSGLLKDGDPINAQVFLSSATAVVSADGTEVRFVPGSGSTAPIPPPIGPPTPAPPPIPEPSSALVFLVLAGLPLAGRRIRQRRAS